ncbi:AraC family transcriptional regulator [Microvirga sp. KLBC 81]|uniref:AraC-like ligand-binding domain-containing protein n=1 Tax=Microvirga sp. KLBC 81 TaxID=1862707 RepID=UPI000D50BB8B|nr:helix-turn-helix domain-containing protein [Microvirga sp. KLBC 81]PVE20951.1 AraC family transcriptional regulator [Microvirga sp. KLBC 81]
MHTAFSTTSVLPEKRSGSWSDAVSSAYFPLELHYRQPANFAGTLQGWTLGDVSLSRLSSDPLLYARRHYHLKDNTEEQYLVTIPVRSDVHFSQANRETRCSPGGFLIEQGHEPYEFSYNDANDLWVLKVPADMLGNRLRMPSRFCCLNFDAEKGSGGLFKDMLEIVPNRYDRLSAEEGTLVGRQLVELLVLAITYDERVLTSSVSSVREAHLARIEQYIRQRLGPESLSADNIARACGISTRYLHELFRGTGMTLAEWVRNQRLQACREALSNPHENESIAQIAYAWGFGDQAQLSRLFKAKFGLSPRDYRRVCQTGGYSPSNGKDGRLE